MRTISALGVVLVKALAGAFFAELLCYGAGALSAHARAIPQLPTDIGEWTASRAQPPVGDGQRDNPDQASLLYTNADRPPIHVDVAAIDGVSCLRLPQRYLVETDGRVAPTESLEMDHLHRAAYTISIVRSVDKVLLVAHWYQRPGSRPVPTAGGDSLAAVRSALVHRPQAYECDAWIEWRPGSDTEGVRQDIQRIADAISDSIKRGSR